MIINKLRLPKVQDLIQLYNLRAINQLSQNFILDKNITDKILKLSKLEIENSVVIEVGPGPGLLTRSIIDYGCKNLIVVEKDPRFLPTLKQLSEATNENMKYIIGDMLTLDPATILKKSSLPIEEIQKVHIIGNLPFGVATPLLFQWLNQMYSKDGLFQYGTNHSLTLMFQKEVAQRLVAKPSTKQVSRLSWMTQAVGHPKLIYQVPSSAFVPKPKVDASVVQIQALKEPSLKVPLNQLESLLRIFFLKRRKSIQKIAKDYDIQLLELLKSLQWDLTLRPEDISCEQFCQLANLIDPKLLKLKK